MLKDRNSDQQITNCFPFWQKQNITDTHRYLVTRYPQISGRQTPINIWSTDTHGYLVHRYQVSRNICQICMGIWVVVTTDDIKSNQITINLAIWTYTWDCETNDFSATGKRSPGPCFKTVFEDFNFSQNRLASTLVSFILTFQDAPDSAKNRPIDLQKLGNRGRKWTFDFKEKNTFLPRATGPSDHVSKQFSHN